MRPSLAPCYLNFSWSFQAFKSYKQTRGCVNLFTTASEWRQTQKQGTLEDWVSWDFETCIGDFEGWCNERRSRWWRKFRPNDEYGGVVQYAQSAASTPLSGRWQAHPRDGGLLFADLVALSVGSECMGWWWKFGTWAGHTSEAVSSTKSVKNWRVPDFWGGREGQWGSRCKASKWFKLSAEQTTHHLTKHLSWRRDDWNYWGHCKEVVSRACLQQGLLITCDKPTFVAQWLGTRT